MPQKSSRKVNLALLTEKSEIDLIKILSHYPTIINDSVINYDPSILANYLYTLAKYFSRFYEDVPVVQAEEKVKKARLFLLDNIRTVLASGLSLLGIEEPEKM